MVSIQPIHLQKANNVPVSTLGFLSYWHTSRDLILAWYVSLNKYFLHLSTLNSSHISVVEMLDDQNYRTQLQTYLFLSAKRLVILLPTLKLTTTKRRRISIIWKHIYADVCHLINTHCHDAKWNWSLGISDNLARLYPTLTESSSSDYWVWSVKSDA